MCHQTWALYYGHPVQLITKDLNYAERDFASNQGFDWVQWTMLFNYILNTLLYIARYLILENANINQNCHLTFNVLAQSHGTAFSVTKWLGFSVQYLPIYSSKKLAIAGSVTRSGDLLDFGQLFKAFGNN